MLRTAALIAVTGLSAWNDLKTFRIPNRILVPGTMAAVVISFIKPLKPDPLPLLIIMFFLLVLQAAFIKGLVGGGDIKLYTFLVLLYPDERALLIIKLSVISAAAIVFLSLGRMRNVRLGVHIFFGALVCAFCGWL